MELKSEIMVTEAAKAHLIKGGAGAAGLRLIIKGGKGCGGNEYDLKPVMADDVNASEDFIKLSDSFSLFVDPADVLRLFGTRIDFIEDDLGNRRLDFMNPNETGRCGCGKSVTF
ncbi:MAG: iron-sulfur cluster biosynthesis family protein [Pseudobdellovibrionaceae bacterium]|jgi:iron-sulfur cluster assembly protein|nr:iron-sulfur cluster biosynthesis family protein [Pseudobdellovibrionaceae bacterium]